MIKQEEISSFSWMIPSRRFYHIAITGKRVHIDGKRLYWWRAFYMTFKLLWLILIGYEPLTR